MQKCLPNNFILIYFSETRAAAVLLKLLMESSKCLLCFGSKIIEIKFVIAEKNSIRFGYVILNA